MLRRASAKLRHACLTAGPAITTAPELRLFDGPQLKDLPQFTDAFKERILWGPFNTGSYLGGPALAAHASMAWQQQSADQGAPMQASPCSCRRVCWQA